MYGIEIIDIKAVWIYNLVILQTYHRNGLIQVCSDE
jgi:hypothetical protein